MTGPVKIGHVGSQNLTTFQTFVTHNFVLKYGMATQLPEIVQNLTGFSTHFTEPKYYISVLRYISSNYMIHFSPHALFSQARSHFYFDFIFRILCFLLYFFLNSTFFSFFGLGSLIGVLASFSCIANLYG